MSSHELPVYLYTDLRFRKASFADSPISINLAALLAFCARAVTKIHAIFGYRALRLRGGNRLRPLWPETLPEPWPSPMELCRRAMKPTTASAIVIKILRMTRRNTVRVQLGLRLTTHTSLLEAWRKRSSTDNAAERSWVAVGTEKRFLL